MTRFVQSPYILSEALFDDVPPLIVESHTYKKRMLPLIYSNLQNVSAKKEFLMERSIGSGKNVILVYGQELSAGPKAPFCKWLYKDYKTASHYGWCPDCPWVYVNLELKTYFSGLPGIKVTDCLNEHAVTISEFYTILAEYEKNHTDFDKSEAVVQIYAKYKGKGPFVFFNERFDCDEGTVSAEKMKAE